MLVVVRVATEQASHSKVTNKPRKGLSGFIMITTLTKELPFVLNTPISKGRIAFVGDQTHCSNYAARYCKYNLNTEIQNTLTLTSDLPKNIYTSVTLYYAGDFNSYEITAGTDLVVAVTDNVDVMHDFIVENQNINIQHVPCIGSDGLTYYNHLLQATDWVVLRELERMFLADTELAISRDRYRALIDNQIADMRGLE